MIIKRFLFQVYAFHIPTCAHYVMAGDGTPALVELLLSKGAGGRGGGGREGEEGEECPL